MPIKMSSIVGLWSLARSNFVPMRGENRSRKISSGLNHRRRRRSRWGWGHGDRGPLGFWLIDPVRLWPLGWPGNGKAGMGRAMLTSSPVEERCYWADKCTSSSDKLFPTAFFTNGLYKLYDR